jgi:hypothetical protein
MRIAGLSRMILLFVAAATQAPLFPCGELLIFWFKKRRQFGC